MKYYRPAFAATLQDAVKSFARLVDNKREEMEKFEDGFSALQFALNRVQQLEQAMTAAGVPIPPPQGGAPAMKAPFQPKPQSATGDGSAKPAKPAPREVPKPEAEAKV